MLSFKLSLDLSLKQHVNYHAHLSVIVAKKKVSDILLIHGSLMRCCPVKDEINPVRNLDDLSQAEAFCGIFVKFCFCLDL